MKFSSKQRALIQGPVGSYLSSVDGTSRPVLARILGTRVVDSTMRVFVSVAQSAGVLDAVAAGRPVAAVFASVTTYESLQFKAASAELEPMDEADQAAARGFRRSMNAGLMSFGMPDGALPLMYRDDLIAIAFAPTDVFNQTPGPGAGRRIEAGL
jgi:hypothetical protein